MFRPVNEIRIRTRWNHGTVPVTIGRQISVGTTRSHRHRRTGSARLRQTSPTGSSQYRSAGIQYPLSRCGADARLSCLPGRAGAVPRAAGDQAGGAATRDTLALARVIVAPRSEEHQMSVFIVSRRAGRSRPVATRRCTTKGAGAAGTPGRAGSALPDPPPLCRLPRCRGRVMAWPAAGSGVVAAGGRGGGEDEQAQYQARQSPAPRGA
jgi:hypothetical protein